MLENRLIQDTDITTDPPAVLFLQSSREHRLSLERGECGHLLHLCLAEQPLYGFCPRMQGKIEFAPVYGQERFAL